MYTTSEGDRWDWISYVNYGDCNYYDEIIKANKELPEDIKLSPILPANIELRIPDIKIDRVGEIPPWRK